MDNTHLLYLQKIPDTLWVAEMISEKFDDALNMMTKNSVIYGGAVRDCLAGKELIGDLDIVVFTREYHILVDRFVKNPKWVLTSINDESQKSTYDYKVCGPWDEVSPFKTSTLLRRSPKVPYLTVFKTLDNRMVQIISPPLFTDGNTSFQTLLHFTKQVDIVCCGVIFTNDNEVFEVVPNAYNDCKNHILHLNDSFDVVNLEHLKARIKKFVSRGWINDINMGQIIKKMRKKQKQMGNIK